MLEVAFKSPDFAAIKKEGLKGFDMHVHTRYSLDAIADVRNLCKKAQQLGIGFAVTDHNDIRGAAEAIKQKKVPIIPGIEVTCSQGTHMIAYFYDYPSLEEFYDKQVTHHMRSPFSTSLSVEHFVESALEHDCVICAPHPFGPGMTGVMKQKLDKKTEDAIKAIEVINGYELRSNNRRSCELAVAAGKGATGGSDAHSTQEFGKVVACSHAHDVEGVLKHALKGQNKIVGEEEAMFLRIIMALEKEGKLVKTMFLSHKLAKFLEGQIGPEYRYLVRQIHHQRMHMPFLHQHPDHQAF